MPLYEMTASAMVPVPVTTFSREEVLERAGLQRVLRDHVNVVAPGVLVVAEEFAAFEDARRRIDLLGVDQEGTSSSWSSSGPPTAGTSSFRRSGTPPWSAP